MKNIIRQFCGTLFVPFYFYLSGVSSLFMISFGKEKSKISRKISSFWALSTFFLVKLLFVKNIRLFYDPAILETKRSILVSNHSNNLDWLVIWMSLLSLKKKDIIFNAKNTILFYGNMFQILSDENINFVFLKRNINYDYITLVESCKELKTRKQFVSVLFPEGTLNTKQDSKEINFSRSLNRNIDPFLNVMVPKTKGFKIMMENLKDELDGIIDCTIVYRKIPTILSFLKGQRVCIDIYLKKLETPQENYEQWLMDLFRVKDSGIGEETKKKFYTINVSVSQRYKHIITFAIPWMFRKLQKKYI